MMEPVFFFVFFYPLFMAIFWITGAVLFFVRRERHENEVPVLPVHPKVAILVPCHNEVLCISDVIQHLDENKYPNFEIIAINDGSSDATGEILEQLAGEIERLRVVTLTHNYGKAMALRAGAMASTSEFLMCIDADALLDRDALFWMMRHFLNGPRVGAVTGNPRVSNRASLLARIQIGEFSAIIGMIKRAQRGIGRLFTVSGVNACYRRAAVHNVGYWSPETVTEDVDMSWKLQLAHWDIRFEPKALTWILVPESLKSLWRQRLRWAQGGFEAAVKYAGAMKTWLSRRMWTVVVEYWLGVVWCVALAMTFLFWAFTNFLPEGVWPASLSVPTLVPGWTGVMLGLICILQFAVGLAIDSHYERRGLFRYLFWAIWYPAIYWVLSAFSTLGGVYKGLVSKKRKQPGVFGTWVSPERKQRSVPVVMKKHHIADRRQQFAGSDQDQQIRIQTSQWVMTVLFWGLWLYLIAPLISLFFWLGGVYLFLDRMVALGGYQELVDKAYNYSLVILVMWTLLGVWVIWNQKRYGKKDRRHMKPNHVSRINLKTSTGLDFPLLDQLRHSKEIYIHFDEDKRPVIESRPRNTRAMSA